MPWGVILMVTGVTVLIALLQETEGLALITTGIANLSTPATIEPIVGVRRRARVGLQQHVGRRAAGVPADGARSRAAARRSRSAADRLVDERRREPRRSVVAVDGRRAVHRGRGAGLADTRKLFNELLAWGLSMSVVGAVLCYILFG